MHTQCMPIVEPCQLKSNEKYIFYIVFQVLKVFLIKISKIQPLDLVSLDVILSFYISRYHFAQTFRTSFNIIWKKKEFCDKFSFFNGFSQTLPHSLNGQNLLSMANVLCKCSLTLLSKNLQRRVTLLFPLIFVFPSFPLFFPCQPLL